MIHHDESGQLTEERKAYIEKRLVRLRAKLDGGVFGPPTKKVERSTKGAIKRWEGILAGTWKGE